MAQGIVDDLEAVDIDQQHIDARDAAWPSAAPRARASRSTNRARLGRPVTTVIDGVVQQALLGALGAVTSVRVPMQRTARRP